MTIPGLNIDLKGDVPVYRQIADAIRAALEDGSLRPGNRLPPTRDLARQLGVNRNTVVSAYDQLAAAGWVHSRTGRGTFVAQPPAAAGGDDATGITDGTWLAGFSRAVEGPALGRLQSVYRLAISTEGISFASSMPDSALLPVEAFTAAMSRALGHGGARLLTYGPVQGVLDLRRSIARSMRDRGSSVRSDGILITNGSQQALELVFRTLLDPGSPVVLEDPTFTGALSALGSLQARMIGVPMDDQGLRPDLLEAALQRHRPRVIYVQPTFHNPTSRVMGLDRRLEILALAGRYGCVVVEDDWAGDLRFEGDDLPTLHALDRAGRVVYVSTFSKKLMPGLRIGWLAAPSRLIERLVALKQAADCGTSPLVQQALQHFLEAGGLEEHLARARPRYRSRRDAMLRALDRHFPEGVDWSRPTGGLFVWVELPAGLDSNELFLAAREGGVLFSRGELFHVDGGGRATMRLAFGGVDEQAISTGIKTLGGLIGQRLAEAATESDGARTEALPIF